MRKVLDFSSLIHDPELLKEDGCVVSTVTLRLLERTGNKKVLQAITKYKPYIWIYKTYMLIPIDRKRIEIDEYIKELAAAVAFDKEVAPDDTMFVTNSMYLANIANLFFGDDSIYEIEDQT